MQPTEKRYKMNPSFLDKLDRMNKEFFQFDMRQVDEKMAKVEAFINEHRVLVPFSANEAIAEKLHELSGKIGKFIIHSQLAKRLTAEVESLARTVFMPAEVLEMVRSYLDPLSFIRLDDTGRYYRDEVSHSFFKMVSEQLLGEAIKTAHNLEYQSLTDRSLLQIASVIAKSDPFNAWNLASGWVADVKGPILFEMASIDPQRAMTLAEEHLSEGHCRNRVYYAAVQAVAKKDIEQALAIAMQFENFKVKATSLNKIVECIRDTHSERAKVIFRQALEFADEDEMVAEMIRVIAPIDHTLALESVNRLQDPRKKLWAKRAVAVAIVNRDLQSACVITNQIQDLEVKCRTLVQIAIAVLPIDLEQAIQLFNEGMALDIREFAQYTKEELSRDFARALSLVDLNRALQIARKLRPAPFGEGCLSEICQKIAPSDPVTALRISEEIRQGSNKYSALEAVIKGLLPQNPAEALRLTNSLAKGYFIQKNRLYGEIALSRAKIDLDEAMGYVKLITEQRVKSLVLVKIALQIACEQPAAARKLIVKALELSRGVTDGELKAYLQFNILQTIHHFLHAKELD